MTFRSCSRIAVLGAALCLAASAGAQEARPFKDSWFWGLKVGTLAIETSASERTWAPTVGADWMITRTAGGLYVFADYTNFDITARVSDPGATGGQRDVEVNDLRRVGFAAVVFPKTFGRFRPYAGLGATLNIIGRAAADISVDPVDSSMEESIDEARSRAAIIGLLGGQAQLGRIALFTQLTTMPSNRKFLIDEGMITGLELGIRYNFGTSIDK